MSNVFNRITKVYKKSVNTPDYPVSEWIINPIFIPNCDKKYMVVEGDTIREMTVKEKEVVDYIEPVPEPLPPTAEELERKRKSDIAAEIANVYTIADELSIHRRLLQGTLKLSDVECVEWLSVIDAAKLKYDKV